eukprot:CAMPEP_0177567828 /NCGR_PEP_ID=MMETSP0369-20130122/75431_1 /TAXON_ID=447022 ORGANISM="Scrippsiella hangoei-like, Strain SHHI-4" /NCGR_SAMPLE_ID=MMETSP0369 /ASSEMBLY_ACC=CAM_ASM_000364 /LENGTH=117 /DNA_ID=CAMNT_0019055357 /DNA_START=397 /DNA_END=747 /DNA_ORIENTATION=+
MASGRLGRELRSLHKVDGPEVRAQVGDGDEVVGHEEVALASPLLAPAVADDEVFLLVVVADGHDRVATQHRVVQRGHGHVAGGRHLLGHEGGEDREAEGEGEASGDAGLHVLQGLRH